MGYSLSLPFLLNSWECFGHNLHIDPVYNVCIPLLELSISQALLTEWLKCESTIILTYHGDYMLGTVAQYVLYKALALKNGYTILKSWKTCFLGNGSLLKRRNRNSIRDYSTPFSTSKLFGTNTYWGTCEYV